jgi:ankyrin repeat protein
MALLPEHPDLDHLRRQARDLLRAVRAGDADALRRLEPATAQPTLAAAQLAVAREYGFASWPKLKAEVEARTLALAEKAEAFCRASVSDWTGRAVRMLAETPELAGYDFATAVVLGDVPRVRLALARDPGLATRHDSQSGWTALHLVSGSRWHSLDPTRADGLVAVARLLLDAGAGVGVESSGLRRRGGGRTALRCAAGSASTGLGHERVMRLLLERGAVVEDHDLYLVAFGRDDHRCLRLLLEHTSEPTEAVAMAFAAPVSMDDAEAVRLLLDAGADPRRYRNDEDRPSSAVFEAISAGCTADLVELLLMRGADPNGKGSDGQSAYQAATAQGRPDLRELLHRHGATDDASDADRLLLACLQGDRPEAERLLAGSAGLHVALDELLGRAAIRAAETGNIAALGLTLDLGSPVDRVTGDDGATALHTAAYAGSAPAVRLLLDRGADIEGRDANWNSTPLDWALVGSGERPRHNPTADWIATVETLLKAGAATDEIRLSPEDPKPPSAEVARLLRSHGIGESS